MNHEGGMMSGWMNRWAGGEMWAWMLVGGLLVVLLAFAIIKLTRK